MAERAAPAAGRDPGDEQQVETLVRRLAETEAALSALIAGEVDAVVNPLTAAPFLLQDAQQALRASEARYRELVERSPAIVCELAPDGRTLFANEAVTAILGYRPDELVGRDWWETLCPDSQPAPHPDAARGAGSASGCDRVAELRELLRRGDVTGHEMLLRARDGSPRIVAWNTANRYGADHALETVVAFGIDLTERRHAEEAIRRLASEQAARAAAEAAERRAAFLAEASRALGASLDHGHTLSNLARLAVPAVADCCVVDVVEDNGAICRLKVVHVDPDLEASLGGQERHYLTDPDAPAGVPEVLRTGRPTLIADVKAEGLEPLIRQAQHLAMLEQLDPTSLIIAPLIARTRTLGAITLVTCASNRVYERDDLTLAEELAHRAALAVDNARLYKEAESARAEAEAARRAAETARAEAERANKAKSEFLATMSHELRTPLNAIGGYTQLLDEEIRGPITPAQRRDLERIRNSQIHLLGLINDVLNFAKIEAGHVKFDIADVPVDESLSKLESLIGPQLREKELAYAYVGGDRQVTVRADRERMEQVVVNLLSNALKFTPKGGRIELSWRATPDAIAITVRDTGVGIPADRVESVFEPFVQVDNTLTRTSEGTGLGLAISRDLARVMGGDLTVESEVGVGSAFTLRLPRAG